MSLKPLRLYRVDVRPQSMNVNWQHHSNVNKINKFIIINFLPFQNLRGDVELPAVREPERARPGVDAGDLASSSGGLVLHLGRRGGRQTEIGSCCPSPSGQYSSQLIGSRKHVDSVVLNTVLNLV